ncbi:carbohydrate-binding protein [Agaribacterium sp. ZY112]|uniref:carbohydrate-binding protein n=1 Tax=Agaribacterium sp. ZY112 TaxID=3233574 RepID=UPI00352350F0
MMQVKKLPLALGLCIAGVSNFTPVVLAYDECPPGSPGYSPAPGPAPMPTMTPAAIIPAEANDVYPQPYPVSNPTPHSSFSKINFPTLNLASFTSTGGDYNGFEIYDANGTIAINYNQRGDWAKYYQEFNDWYAQGSYAAVIYAASPESGAVAEISVGGRTVRANIPNTGGWDNFVPVRFNDPVNISYGSSTVNVKSAGNTASTWEWNASKIVFGPEPPQPKGLTRIEAERYQRSGGTYGGATAYLTPNGEQGINHNQTGDWLEYDIRIDEAGTYELNILAATPMQGAAAQITFSNGASLYQEIGFSADWDNFQTNVGLVELPAGNITMRVEAAGNTTNDWEWNADAFEFTLKENTNEPILAMPLYIEAEDFDDSDGFTQFSSGAVSGISSDLTGASAGYDITTGYVHGGQRCDTNLYDATYNVYATISAPFTGSQIELLLDGELIKTTDIASDNNEEGYKRIYIGYFSVEPGQHRLSIRTAAKDSTEQQSTWRIDRLDFEPMPLP